MDKYKKLKTQLNKNYKEIAVAIAKDYSVYGSYNKLSKIYGTGYANLCRLIRENLDYIQKSYPEVYDTYTSKINENNEQRLNTMRKNSAKTRRKSREYLPYFNNRAFKELPKQIKYDDFLNWCVKFNTGDLTGVDLISMAAKNGIKITN